MITPPPASWRWKASAASSLPPPAPSGQVHVGQTEAQEVFVAPIERSDPVIPAPTWSSMAATSAIRLADLEEAPDPPGCVRGRPGHAVRGPLNVADGLPELVAPDGHRELDPDAGLLEPLEQGRPRRRLGAGKGGRQPEDRRE